MVGISSFHGRRRGVYEREGMWSVNVWLHLDARSFYIFHHNILSGTFGSWGVRHLHGGGDFADVVCDVFVCVFVFVCFASSFIHSWFDTFDRKHNVQNLNKSPNPEWFCDLYFNEFEYLAWRMPLRPHSNHSRERTFIRVELNQSSEQQEVWVYTFTNCCFVVMHNKWRKTVIYYQFAKTCLTFCFMPLHAKYLDASLSN